VKCLLKILDAAVVLAITLDTNEGLAIVKKGLSTGVKICTQGLNDSRILNAISGRLLAQASKNCCSSYRESRKRIPSF